MKKTWTIFLALLFVCYACPTAQAAGYAVITEPQYNMAEAYFGSVAKVSKDLKWTLVDAGGKPVTSSGWDSLGNTASDRIPAEKDGKWGYIDQSGKTVIAYQFSAAGAFQDDIALVYTAEERQAYIDKNGKILFFSPFTYSFAASGGAVCGVMDDLYGFSDTEGHIIITPQFEMAHDFHEGYAAVRAGGKWGYVTTDGSYSIKPAYENCGDFQNGYAICRLAGKYGIINTAGKRVSPFTFDYIGMPDDQGRYPAKSGDISGYISFDGTWLLKTNYAFCYAFTDGVARVYQDEKWGYIDESGNEIVPPTFVDCGEYRSGLAPFSLDGLLWGYLSLDTAPKETIPVVPTPAQPTDTPDKNIIEDTTGLILPLAPDGARCISMKIGSNVALMGDKAYALSAAPVLLDGTTMIPVRDVVELLGGTVNWNAENQRINMTRKFRTITMTINSRIAFVNGTPTSLVHAPVLLDGSTVVPLRSVTDGWDFSLKWLNTEQNIYIYF